MKKIFGVLVLLFFAMANVSAQDVDRMTIKVTNTSNVDINNQSKVSMWVNDSAYITIFLTDKQMQQVGGKQPIVVAEPSYPVTVSDVVQCSTEVGQNFCSKLDNSLAELEGAYLVKVDSKWIDDNVALTILSDSSGTPKKQVLELTLGEGKSDNPIVEVETLNDVPATWENQITAIALFLLAIVGFLSYFKMTRKK